MAVVSELRKCHPLFMKLTFKGAGIILNQGIITELKSYQILFKEGFAESVVFIVLYGRAVLRKSKDGVLGLVGVGDSIGEEAILMPKYRFRLESCVGEGNSCLLEFDRNKIGELKVNLNSLRLKADYNIFISLLKRSFNRKQNWRSLKRLH